MTNFPPSEGPDSTWFTEARFGFCFHWGLYSLAARHEWVKSRECISDANYQRYFDRFDPDLFDPVAWAREAKNAGMKYVLIVTKHHDGFCLWDSALTDYKAPNTTTGRDLLRPLIEAFRAEGLRIALYYSLIDWRHPEFPIDYIHPMRFDKALLESEKHRDVRKYAEYLHGQVRELLTNFGKIDVMWFDFSYVDWGEGELRGKGKEDWQSEKLLAMVRELQPHALVCDRLGIPGDFVSPEQYLPDKPMERDGKPVMWECTQTMNESWGYDRDNLNWRPVDMLLRMLIDVVSKNGNMLLNVGPNARGELGLKALDRLRGIGEWMRLHGRSIWGCGASDFTPPPNCAYTQKGNRLYLHIFSWPLKYVHLPALANKVEYAQLLDDASEVKMIVFDPNAKPENMAIQGTEGTLTLVLPIQKPDVEIPVIEMFLKPESPPSESEG